MDQTQQVIKALASPIRREILWAVWHEEQSVGAIAAGLPVSLPTVSEHLAVLRAAGLVEARRDGTTRWYRARAGAIDELRSVLGDTPDKWRAATDHPEQRLPRSRVQRVVVVEVEADCDEHEAFRAFTDPVVYGRWLGVPVSLEDGRFACTMEFGTHVRGTYELVCAPSLIVMRWDFRNDEPPVPGAGRRADLVIAPLDAGRSRLALHQFVDSDDQAAYMDRAWRLVLGRFVEGVRSALDPAAPMPARQARPRASGSEAEP